MPITAPFAEQETVGFISEAPRGERYSPEEYIKNVPVEDVVDEIFDVFESFRKEGKEDIDFRDEYDYYWHILTYRNDM